MYRGTEQRGECPDCGAPWSIYDKVCDCGRLVAQEEVDLLQQRVKIARLAKDPALEQDALRRTLQLLPDAHALVADVRGALDQSIETHGVMNKERSEPVDSSAFLVLVTAGCGLALLVALASLFGS